MGRHGDVWKIEGVGKFAETLWGRELHTWIDHAPVVGCFICPVLLRSRTFIYCVAVHIDIMLRTSKNGSGSRKAEK